MKHEKRTHRAAVGVHATPDAEETLARIETLRAERDKFVAEARKAVTERKAWSLPTTWILLAGTIGGLGSAAFQWQLSRLAAERSGIQVDRAKLELEIVTYGLDKTERALASKRAALLKASDDLERAERALGQAAVEYEQISQDIDQSKLALTVMRNAGTQASQAADAARIASSGDEAMEVLFGGPAAAIKKGVETVAKYLTFKAFEVVSADGKIIGHADGLSANNITVSRISDLGGGVLYVPLTETTILFASRMIRTRLTYDEARTALVR